MAKIGIMGGTFNPIHLGHIKLAQTAYEQLELDTVWFMPSKNPPHKNNDSIASEEDRLMMVSLAIKDYDHFKISDIELKREGTTYTSYTLEYLQSLRESDKNYTDNEYFFIVGADSIFNIESWNRPHILFKLATFVAACRDDVDTKLLTKQCNYLKDKYNALIHIINMNRVSISSSYIRTCYKTNGCDFNYKEYVHPSIHKYILDNNLYNWRNTMGTNLSKIENKLEKKLPSKRFEHTKGVRYTCGCLAMKYGYDIEKAQLAGLLHDCAKYMSDKEILEKCKKHGIEITNEELASPHLLHGKLGAFYAKKKYDIDDAEILEAITYHTTGKPNMSLLCKILYIADYIEPNRKIIPGLDEIRKYAFEDLNKAVLAKINNMSKYLTEKNIEITGIAKETFDYYVTK